MSGEYLLEFRTIDPARRASLSTNTRHQFVKGFNNNDLLNVDPSIDTKELRPAFTANKLNFIIKPYQRGFRWDAKENVRKLLVDLFEYSKLHVSMFGKTNLNDTTDFAKEFDFYCLQTLTVKNAQDDSHWEVIDGQQRLTCMLLLYELLSAFCRSRVNIPYTIEYHREDGTEPFSLSEKIKDYLDAFNDTIRPGDILSESELTREERDCWFEKYKTCLEQQFENDKDQLEGSYLVDSCYIKAAMIEIVDFFSQGKAQYQLNALFECVKRNVFFLWYEIPSESDSEEAFLKINSGAIPLTNAELIKSLVLRKASEDDTVKVYGRKWEEIERGLSKSELWSFIAGSFDSDTRIDLILESYARNNGFLGDTTNNQYCLFDWYDYYKSEKGSDFSKAVIDGISGIFDRICEWYDDVEIYHYVGLLSLFLKMGLNRDFKNQQELLMDLLKEATESEGKKSFVRSLKRKLVKCLKPNSKKVPTPKYVSYLVEDQEEYNNDFFNYNDDGKRIEAVLWLLNIYETVNSNDNTIREKGNPTVYKSVVCRRFPFSEALGGKWSLEHIFPQHPDEKDSKESKATYEKEFGSFIEDRIDEEEIHTIGNLALLKSETNSALQNRKLSAKRYKLIDEIGSGSFVPNSTINAFMLYYNHLHDENQRADDNSITADWNYWTKKDYNYYVAAIIRCLKDFDLADSEGT